MKSACARARSPMTFCDLGEPLLAVVGEIVVAPHRSDTSSALSNSTRASASRPESSSALPSEKHELREDERLLLCVNQRACFVARADRVVEARSVAAVRSKRKERVDNPIALLRPASAFERAFSGEQRARVGARRLLGHSADSLPRSQQRDRKRRAFEQVASSCRLQQICESLLYFDWLQSTDLFAEYQHRNNKARWLADWQYANELLWLRLA